MNQKNKSLSEEEKIKIAKSAFAKFKLKIKKLFKKQMDVFESIMGRINKRKMEEQRRKLDELYRNMDKNKDDN